MRGFMTARGLPDNPRSARVILKDFVRGKLLYCVAPPGSDQEQFNKWPLGAPRERAAGQRPPQERMVKVMMPERLPNERVERSSSEGLDLSVLWFKGPCWVKGTAPPLRQF